MPPRQHVIGRRHRVQRGRPPGIRAERLQALAEMAAAGLTMAEMAAALGVTRQCVHQQLAKCPSISVERQVRVHLRRRVERERHLREQAIRRVQQRSAAGAAFAHFLREAMTRGWLVEAVPGYRPRINGAVVAFHTPRRTRTSTRAPQAQRCTRYYHVQVTRPEWLHVVCLPTGRYVFLLPDPKRRPGSVYIPASRADEPQVWPEWPRAREHHRSDVVKPRPGARRQALPPAWAA